MAVEITAKSQLAEMASFTPGSRDVMMVIESIPMVVYLIALLLNAEMGMSGWAKSSAMMATTSIQTDASHHVKSPAVAMALRKLA